MYYLLVISAHVSSSIIMITSLLDIMVKTKHWNQFAMDISGPAFVLIYNNSTSSVLLVCNPGHNVTSPMDLSNNSLSSNDHGILFLQTSLRNFHHSLNLTLPWSQLTGSPSRYSLFLPTTSLCSQTQHICSFFICFPNTVFLLVSPLIKAQSLCLTFSVS